jgi:hypothetical protein
MLACLFDLCTANNSYFRVAIVATFRPEYFKEEDKKFIKFCRRCVENMKTGLKENEVKDLIWLKISTSDVNHHHYFLLVTSQCHLILHILSPYTAPGTAPSFPSKMKYTGAGCPATLPI